MTMRFMRFSCVSCAFLVHSGPGGYSMRRPGPGGYSIGSTQDGQTKQLTQKVRLTRSSSLSSILLTEWQVFVGAGAVIGPGSIGAKCARAKVMDSLLYALPFHAELHECYSYHCFLRMSKSGIWEPKSGSQRNVSSTRLGILMLSCRNPARLTSYVVVHISLDVVLSEPGSIDILCNKT